MRRVFITGATGFFGKSILSWMARNPDWANGRELVLLSRNPSGFESANSELLRPFSDRMRLVAGDVRDFSFPEDGFDEIVHAATSASTTISDAEQSSVIVDGTRHVLDFAAACGCRKILFTSSGAVYGPQVEAVGEDAPCRPTTAYGRAKLVAEQMLVESGLDVKIARCFAFVGPYLNRGIHYAIGNFIRDALAKREIVVSGDGTPLRSYMYADDLVEWLLAILERGKPGRPYNVGSDSALSIRDLAETVRRTLGSPCPVRVLGKPTGAPASAYVPDVTRARIELGLSVSVPLEEAIRRSAE